MSYPSSIHQPSEAAGVLQARQLMPVALPSDVGALALIADAVSEHNRLLTARQSNPTDSRNPYGQSAVIPTQGHETLYESEEHGILPKDASSPLRASGVSLGSVEIASGAGSCQLTPWLATSLAPIGATVAIQAHWRGWVSRQGLGPLAPRMLQRRGAVCIQRAWRTCRYSSVCPYHCSHIPTLHVILVY